MKFCGPDLSRSHEITHGLKYIGSLILEATTEHVEMLAITYVQND